MKRVNLAKVVQAKPKTKACIYCGKKLPLCMIALCLQCELEKLGSK